MVCSTHLQLRTQDGKQLLEESGRGSRVPVWYNGLTKSAHGKHMIKVHSASTLLLRPLSSSCTLRQTFHQRKFHLMDGWKYARKLLLSPKSFGGWPITSSILHWQGEEEHHFQSHRQSTCAPRFPSDAYSQKPTLPYSSTGMAPSSWKRELAPMCTVWICPSMCIVSDSESDSDTYI